MRLTPEQIEQITSHALNIYGDKTNVYLFGSRVDDTARGGDIDLYIETEKKAELMDKLTLMVALQKSMGDQKIDIVVKTPESKSNAIYEIAKEQGIKLN